MLAAYTLPDPQEALLQATLHIPQYCRDHPVDAFAMTLYRQPVLATAAPEPLRQRVVGINDEGTPPCVLWCLPASAMTLTRGSSAHGGNTHESLWARASFRWARRARMAG